MALIRYAPLFLYMHKSKVSHDIAHKKIISFRLYQGRKNRRRYKHKGSKHLQHVLS